MRTLRMRPRPTRIAIIERVRLRDVRILRISRWETRSTRNPRLVLRDVHKISTTGRRRPVGRTSTMKRIVFIQVRQEITQLSELGESRHRDEVDRERKRWREGKKRDKMSDFFGDGDILCQTGLGFSFSKYVVIIILLSLLVVFEVVYLNYV